MALKRPAPKTFTAEEAERIDSAISKQEVGVKRLTSYDPEHFPVFDVPVNQKVLVYVPNHKVQQLDGSMDMRMDKFMAHTLKDGRSYPTVRCISGLTNDNPQLNWDGECPLCQGMQDCWDLYRKEYDDICASKGYAVGSAEEQADLKQDRIDLIRNQAIKAEEEWLIFPIVVIDCEEKDGVKTTTPKLTADGKMSGTPMWYPIRQRTYEEHWGSAFDQLDDGSTNPAGLWAVLNFTYTPKSGNHDKMGSAKALKVTYKTYEQYADWAKYFDSLTAEWTPIKAREVVVIDAIYSKEETQEIADTVLKATRDKLALYALNGVTPSSAPSLPQTGSPEAQLANFGAQPETPQAAPAPTEPLPQSPAGGLIGEMPNAGIQ